MNQKSLVPISILVAAIIIAGAVLLTNKKDTPNTGGPINIEISEVTGGDWIKGSVDARIKLIEFSDTECPFCKGLHNTLNELVTEYDGNDLAWIYRHLPLQTIHHKAPFEANATECAGELGGNDGFWRYIDKLYEITPSNNGLDLSKLPEIAEEVGLDREAFQVCLDEIRYKDEVEKDIADVVKSADHLGGNVGTPFSILVVDEGINDAATSIMESINEQYRRSIGRDLITISDDRIRAAISGNLPKEMFTGIFDAILGK
ncbi:MAG: DsbA family protein [Candidatus Pacebacteria bacterium]|nr:DsbA family protein [Candidatus Paceibacterota bacterium]